jgi:hypothetical protein
MKKIALVLTVVAVIGMLISGAVFASDVTDPKVINPIIVTTDSDVTDPK